MTKLWIWRLVRIVVGIGLLAYVLSRSDWHVLGSLVATPWLIGMIVAFPVVGAAVEALRLVTLCDAQGLSVPFAISFRAVAIGTFFNFCMPGATGGDIAKMWYLNAVVRCHPAELVAVWFVDRLSGLIALILIVAAVGVVNVQFVEAHPLLRWLLASAVLAIVAIVALPGLASTRLADAVRRLLNRLGSRWDVWRRVAQALGEFRDHRSAVLKAVGISLLGNIALLATFVELGRFFTPHVAPRLVSLITLFGFFANALPVTPGGLGVGETAFDTLFRLAGATTGAELLVAWRLGMAPFCLLGWLLYMVGARHRISTARPEPSAAVALP